MDIVLGTSGTRPQDPAARRFCHAPPRETRGNLKPAAQARRKTSSMRWC
jgi:hypothetical protein